jgi:hypothetical protein
MLIARENIDLQQQRIYTVTYAWLAEAEEITNVNLLVDPISLPLDTFFSVVDVIIMPEGKSIQFKAVANAVPEQAGEEFTVNIIVTTNIAQQNDDEIRFLVIDDGDC